MLCVMARTILMVTSDHRILVVAVMLVLTTITNQIMVTATVVPMVKVEVVHTTATLLLHTMTKTSRFMMVANVIVVVNTSKWPLTACLNIWKGNNRLNAIEVDEATSHNEMQLDSNAPSEAFVSLENK